MQASVLSPSDDDMFSDENAEHALESGRKGAHEKVPLSKMNQGSDYEQNNDGDGNGGGGVLVNLSDVDLNEVSDDYWNQE